MGQLDGKVAFVTGVARGQGRSHALRLAQEGADVIGVDLCDQVDTVPYAMSTETDLEETIGLVESVDRRIVARRADVRDPDALAAVLTEGVAELGRLDVVSANAGITGFASVDDMSPDTWSNMIDTNLTGVWNTCRAAVPHIRAGGRGGSMVLTSSVAGLHVFRGMPHYVASKHAVVGLMKALAVELGPEGIRVNSVHPTQVDTPMLANDYVYGAFRPDLASPTKDDAAVTSQTMHVLPVPWVEAVDISNAIVFLASEQARYITGVALPVDCGADLIG